jgi:rfaE bifunctional protein nucleotidyltransferase chain/domain
VNADNEPSPWAVPTRAGKVMDASSLAARLATRRAAGLRIVLSQGCFDLVHLGHLRHFRQARSFGDLLVVAVTEDRHVTKGPGRPLFTQEERVEALAELECVDYVVPNPTATALPVLTSLRPDVYVRGAEYEVDKRDDPRFAVEQDFVATYGGRIAFTGDVLVRSSTELHRYLR